VLAGQVVVKFALFLTFTAMTAVLLPALVAELDPVGKVATLAAIATTASIVNAVSQPIVGVLSDRTASPLGRRVPWMLAGAIIGGLAVGALGGASSLVLIAVLWPLAQLALNGIEAPLDAYLVDDFPPARRGNVAGVVGLALVVGTSAGALLGGALVSRPATATWILAGAVVLSVAGFALLVRDAPTTASRRPRRTVGERVRVFIGTVRENPAFARILAWRVGYSIAYGAVFSYLLYILTDHIGVTTAEAGRVIGLATILAGAASAITVVLSGWLSDRLGRRIPFIVAGNAVLVAGDILLLVSPTVPVALVAATLFGIGLGLSISCGRALASEVLPDPEGGAATGLGLLSTAASAGQAAAPALAAFAIGVGGYPALFILSIAGAVGCSIAVSGVAPDRRRRT
jgi:MFS family permease